MGACYSVFVKMKIKKGDEGKLLDAMNASYEREIERGTNFCIEKYDFKSPQTIEQYMDLFFTKHQNMYDSWKEETKSNVAYVADSGFDASYGWHRLMYDMFAEAAPYLLRGSRLDIYDDDHVIYRAKEGKVY